MNFEFFIKKSNVHFLLPQPVQFLGVLRDRLLDIKSLYGLILVVFYQWLQLVYTTRKKPAITPFLEIKVLTHYLLWRFIVCLCKGSYKIRELSILPLVFLKIVCKTFFEGIISENVMNLLQKRQHLCRMKFHRKQSQIHLCLIFDFWLDGSSQ